MSWDNAFSALIGAPISAAISSPFTWFLTRQKATHEFYIVKERMKIEARRELVATWRRELVPLTAGSELFAGTRKDSFMATSAFASWRPRLSKEFLSDLESQALRIEMGRGAGSGPSFPHRNLIKEIARIESEWGLI
jgi:hypothetical protein